MPQISVRNLQRAITIDAGDLESFATQAVQQCLKLPNRKQTLLTTLPEISVLIVSDRRMAGLHEQFLHQHGPTDVLTFEHGEIFIGAGTARRNARSFKNSLANEVRLYVVHGLLHLHGFDDRKEADALQMKITQEKILASLADV